MFWPFADLTFVSFSWQYPRRLVLALLLPRFNAKTTKFLIVAFITRNCLQTSPLWPFPSFAFLNPAK
jgi:hypothetical protein